MADTADTTIDQYSIADLCDRYQLGRTALYDRFNALDIKPEKRKNRAYLSAEQVEQLDRLDAHLKRGDTLVSFVQSVHRTSGEHAEQVNLAKSQDSGNQLGTVGAGSEAIDRAGSEAIAPYQPPPWYLMTVEAIVEAIFRRLIPMVPVQAPVVERSPGTRLAHLRELEEAYEKGWLLSTSELADLLGLSVNTVRGYGEQFEEAGFVFRRVGHRARGEIAWQVGKLTLLEAQPAS